MSTESDLSIELPLADVIDDEPSPPERSLEFFRLADALLETARSGSRRQTVRIAS